MTSENIWDYAIKQNKTSHSRMGTSLERTLLLIGNQGVGKSTMMHRFVDRREAPKPTLALDYSFCRKSNQNLVKEVCHVWELGGGTSYTNLLETPLSPTKLRSIKLIIMVDLSEPNRLWYTLEKLLDTLKNLIRQSLNTEYSKEIGLNEERLKELNANPEVENHPDRNKIEPLPVPLVIIGGKYDEFQNMEPEKKKIICRALRFIAHRYGGSLQFYSSKDQGLIKRGHDLLSHLAFGTDHWKGLSQDYKKPLFIPAGSDSLTQIAGGSSDEDGEFVGTFSLDVWKQQYTTHFPQTVAHRDELPPNPSNDPNFREPLIDKIKSQKDQELERYKRDIELRNETWKAMDLDNI